MKRQPDQPPGVDAVEAEALIRREEERLGRLPCTWYIVDKSLTEFSFRTVSAMHSAATVDRRTGVVHFDDEA